MNPTIESEVKDAAVTLVPEDDRQLSAIILTNGLVAEAAQSLKLSFAPLFSDAHKIMEESRRIVVTDASQKLQMKFAKDYRLALKNIRVAGDKKHKELKEDSLRRGKAIDGFKNILADMISTEENRLEQQENFVEVQEEKRKAALRAERTQILTGLQIDPNLYQVAEMTEQTFQQLIEGTKLARTAEAERKRKEEAERIERETKEAAERERIRLDNERLQKEAAEKEAALKIEREARAKQEREAAEEKRIAEEKAKVERERADKELAEIQKKYAEERRVAEEKARKEKEAADKKAAEDRAAREKAEATLKAHRAAEAKRLADIAEAKRKADAAPDKDRLLNYANAIRAIDIPQLSTNQALTTLIGEQRNKFIAWLETSVEKL